MNHLVFLDTRAGELERILSGMKTMLIKELDPAQPAPYPVCPDDSLYFLRDNGERAVRVQATVVRVLSFTNSLDQDLSHALKELQPRLQLTEDQYNTWSAKQQVLVVEFESAHKIGVIQIAECEIVNRSDWIAFEECSLVAEEKGAWEHQTFPPQSGPSKERS
jgi:hypothetical protein